MPVSPLKSFVLLGAGLVLLTGCVRKAELDQAQGEVAALQEKVRRLEQQRVPRADLDQSHDAVAAAQERVAALAQELAVTRQQLSGTQAQLAAAEDRLAAVARPANPSVDPKAPPAASSPGLVKGTYTLKDDTLVYSRDAQLNFSNGVTISSPSGLMLSDKDREIVAGDLVVELPPRAPAADNASSVKSKEPAEHPPGTK